VRTRDNSELLTLQDSSSFAHEAEFY